MTKFNRLEAKTYSCLINDGSENKKENSNSNAIKTF